MRDPLNFFEPFEHLPAGHENQLTRAFLVLLRHSPLAHQVWLHLVDPGLALHSLPRPEWRTQQGRISEVSSRAAEERLRGISVIQAADTPVISGDVVESDRRAVYDGVITYGDDLVIVIENKLDGPLSDRQAREINRHDAGIDFDPRPRPVSWRLVLDGFADLVDSDRALAGGAERALIEDFLEFCQRHFPGLLPFSTLRRCARDPQRIRRRLGAVVARLAPDPQDAEGHKLTVPDRATVERAYLDVDFDDMEQPARVSVWMFPADTLGQARQLWSNEKKVSALRALLDRDWRIAPNMHFTYRGTGLVDTHGPLRILDYISYWQEHIEVTRALERAEWNSYWDRLLESGIANLDDRAAFDAKFTNTKRHNAVPCPGVIADKGWPLAAAEDADDEGRLAELVRGTVNEMLMALEEPEVPAPLRPVVAPV